MAGSGLKSATKEEVTSANTLPCIDRELTMLIRELTNLEQF
jgi:hypothetical protein